MSTGDIDNELGPPNRLNNLRQNHSGLDAYLRRAVLFKPVRTFFIPYGAGISEDGQRVYISYDVQSNIDGVECESALVTHETVEWALREFCDIGTDYAADPSGHRLANRAEYERVCTLLAGRVDPWDIYSEIIDEQILNAERQGYKDRPIPMDLALYPYTQNERFRLQEAMDNDRSLDEWDKLQEQTKPYTQEEVEYTDTGSEAEHCSKCDHFESTGTCAIVHGQISAAGWCNKWVQYDPD